MLNTSPRLLPSLFFAGFTTLALSGTAIAQEAMDPATVLATINGYEITEEEAMIASQDFAEQLQRVPPEQLRAVIVDALIDLHLLAEAGEEAGLADTDSFERRMAYQRARTLRTTYLVDVLSNEVDEETVRAAYDEAIAEFEPEQERKARHILLESLEDAQAVIEELDGGADFAALAAERSTGPSGPNGGDLGYFGRGRMVPAFEDAAFSLDVGSYSAEPIETQFGFHVILVEEERDTAAPTFEQLGPQIQQSLLQQKFVEAVTDLRDGADITYEVEGVEPPAPPQ